jgi:GT2 family glycosyltransferase
MLPVIIPHYKKPEQLKRCIECLEKQSAPVEIFVHDNSVDNIYFTAAINKGIRKYLDSDCKYIAAINQDMYLEPNAIEEMIKFMDSHPQCGICVPLQLKSDNPEYVICAGGFEAFPAGKHLFGKLEEFKEDMEIPWANGACIFLRKEMIFEIGLLDKNLKLLCSDSDYSFTARSKGWEIWTAVKARGIHEHGVSGKNTNIEMEKLKINDTIYFADKWLTGNLYRALTLEGPRMSAEELEQIMQRLHNALQTLETYESPK